VTAPIVGPKRLWFGPLEQGEGYLAEYFIGYVNRRRVMVAPVDGGDGEHKHAGWLFGMDPKSSPRGYFYVDRESNGVMYDRFAFARRDILEHEGRAVA
jgi:hypothetical protein